MVSVGIDNIDEYRGLLSDGRVGLLTSVTGRNTAGRPAIDVLREICNLTALFAPEHGIRGNIDAGAGVETYMDPSTGLPVYSLYGDGGKHFTEEQLDCFDILVYDIQDIGVRFYTFLSTLHNAIQDCGSAGKRLVVLDRPNPLGGTIVEGGVLDMKYSSFVGCYPLPVRYGLTSGEVANMMNTEQKYGCDLHVVPCGGWSRASLFSDWGRVWRPPSMGLPTFETTLVYAGTCLLEGTNISEGRGTSAPFRMLGAPFIDAELMSAEFNRIGLEGIVSTPAWFKPTASKCTGEQCAGILLHVTDQASLRPVTVGLELLYLLKRLYEREFTFLPPQKPGGRPFITLLCGNNDLLTDWNCDELLDRYEMESLEFAHRKQTFHLYD